MLLIFVFPILFVMMSGLFKVMETGFKHNLKAYGQSAGYSEQALNAIRIVQSFGQEMTEVRNYDRHLTKARQQGVKSHLTTSLAIGTFMFALFCFYAYGFYIGSWLITKQIRNDNFDARYNSGDVLACLVGIVFGVSSVGQASPQMKKIIEGKVSGKVAYDIIDREPKILLDDPKGVKLDKSQVKGHLEFKNVSFRYPAKQD